MVVDGLHRQTGQASEQERPEAVGETLVQPDVDQQFDGAEQPGHAAAAGGQLALGDGGAVPALFQWDAEAAAAVDEEEADEQRRQIEHDLHRRHAAQEVHHAAGSTAGTAPRHR